MLAEGDGARGELVAQAASRSSCVLLGERAGVDADADRDAGLAGGLDHGVDARHVADVAGVDAQLGGAGTRGVDGDGVVEVDVGDDRQRRLGDDRAEGWQRVAARDGDANDLAAGSRASRTIWASVAATSRVSVLVIDCTLMGASPPMTTPPTVTLVELRRCMSADTSEATPPVLAALTTKRITSAYMR